MGVWSVICYVLATPLLIVHNTPSAEKILVLAAECCKNTGYFLDLSAPGLNFMNHKLLSPYFPAYRVQFSSTT